MRLWRIAVMALALMPLPVAAQDGDAVRLFSPVPNGPTAVSPAAEAEPATAPPAPLAPAIRGALHDGATADASPPSSADRPWLVALPASAPPLFQPAR